VLRAAVDQGCQRVVIASGVQATVGYPLDAQVRTDSAVRPLSMYGVCKCFAEAAAHHLAVVEGLSCIVVRIGTFESTWLNDHPNARNMSTFVSERDMSHLLVRCVETPSIQFAIVHGVSDNRFKFLDLSDTMELLDYRPQDDGFLRLGAHLLYSDAWTTRTLGRGRFRSASDPRQADRTGGEE
jgi:nucleoside-diphosphate-sugar epimerase